jgi:hypothetical protein
MGCIFYKKYAVPRKCLRKGCVNPEGSSLFHVGRLNWIFPSLRYIINIRFFVVLKPLAQLFADWTMLFIPSKTPLDILVSA